MSEGAGDDKLLLIHVRMRGALAQDARQLQVLVDGEADRPASDLQIRWRVATDDEELPDFTGELPDSGTQITGDRDFLKVHAVLSSSADCRGPEDCELIFEARLTALTSTPYTLDLSVNVDVRGRREKRPAGELEVWLEVADAP